MTDAFTASNGMTVERDHNNHVVIDRSIGCASVFMADGTALALREFFQHERDEALGRWRWPENPEYVVYRSSFDPSYLYVLNEETADVFGLNSIDGDPNDESVDDDFAVFAAEAFRKAHPERKPWQRAQVGEVWVLSTADGETDAYTAMPVRGGGIAFEAPEGRYLLDDADIESARRIWPEDAS